MKVDSQPLSVQEIDRILETEKARNGKGKESLWTDRDLVTRLVNTVIDLQGAGQPDAARLLEATWNNGSFYFKTDLLGGVMRRGDAGTVERVFSWAQAHQKDHIPTHAAQMLVHMRDRLPELHEKLSASSTVKSQY